MIDVKFFNRKIDFLLSGKEESSAKKAIKLVLSGAKEAKNYHPVFDDFCSRIGMTFLSQSVVNGNSEIIGYIPCLKFYEENIFGKKPQTIELANFTSLEHCNSILAKEVVYTIMGAGEQLEEYENWK